MSLWRPLKGQQSRSSGAAIGGQLQFQNHIRGNVGSTWAGVRTSPITSTRQQSRARFSSPAPRPPRHGGVQVSPVTHSEAALSYQPETGEQGGGEAAPLIDVVQARRFRRVFEERGQPGATFQSNELGPFELREPER